MKTSHLLRAAAIAALLSITPHGRGATAQPSPHLDLTNEVFALGEGQARTPQEFTLETHVVALGPDGTRGPDDIYRLRLRCTPPASGAAGGDVFTCLAFTVQFGSSAESELRSLKGLSYTFNPAQAGGPVLGVPHASFDQLMDAQDHVLPPGNAFHVYTAFIDFHTFCNVFAQPTKDRAGIQDLRALGQRIVHAAAFSEPAVNLGSTVAEGSFFKNGEIVLELKGVSLVNRATCALVGVDSGASSFRMTMKPAPNMEIKIAGSSHYAGDIYLNLATHWVSRVDAHEIVVSETSLPMPPHKMNTVIERTIRILNVTAP